MDTIKSKYHETLAATIIKNLEKRQMEGYYCPTVEDAEKLAFSFLKDGQSVSFGGSMTLEETGMLTALRHDPSIHLIDRSTAKTPEETKKMYHDALSSDVYFMSTNAITANGELVNIDGTGNRVSQTLFGPEKVYFVIGTNKVCPDLTSAMERAKQIAAPKNAARLQVQTPCAKTGVCVDCNSPARICHSIVILERPSNGMEVEVVFVDEEMGY